MALSRNILAIALAAGMAGATGALAQGIMQSRSENNIDYVSGGVGEEQQERMQTLAQQGYTLKLVFAEQGTGAYLADVRVHVADTRGRTLVDAEAEGPVFLARLPDGDYKVILEYGGVRQMRTVHASSRSASTVIYWNAERGSAP